jgi:hypothetical protein
LPSFDRMVFESGGSVNKVRSDSAGVTEVNAEAQVSAFVIFCLVMISIIFFSTICILVLAW